MPLASDTVPTAGPYEAELPDLPAMLAELESSPEIYRPSNFWQQYLALNIRQIEADGFAEFKRTVNRNYFQFQLSDPRHPQQLTVLREWARRPDPRALGARYTPGFEFVVEPASRRPHQRLARRRAYAGYLAMLRDFARPHDDSLRLLERLDEPELGHPICVDYRGRRVSEDLCNSVLELSAVANALPGGRLQRATAIELGSGYGRLAWTFLNAFPGIRYVLVDIPPALAIAERYLTQVLPDRKAFRFRHFDRPEEVEQELAVCDMAFLTPNQLDLLPDLVADLFLNVSSLHEMRRDQIDHYFRLVDRHTAGWFYTKQWLRSVNPLDDLVISRDDYPVPDRWTPVFDRVHPVQVEFFEALYSVASD